jgi:hypothetical protein
MRSSFLEENWERIQRRRTEILEKKGKKRALGKPIPSSSNKVEQKLKRTCPPTQAKCIASVRLKE